METRIAKDQPVVTLINVFTVEPANQERLVEILTEATEQVTRTLPGYVSANIHRSTDGTRVTNYAQWRSQADLDAIYTNPAFAPHMQECAKIATYDAHVYEIIHVDRRDEPGAAADGGA